ncbi:MAG: hypothetical protein LBQ24_05905 [Candidatus Peribacteria bacterium]|jgi:hypothetical protein|nr:hypothetical protein [Candidatus Peribacteria bacterium]
MREKGNITQDKLYSLLPDDYSPEEKEEILMTINNYNAICLEILGK